MKKQVLQENKSGKKSKIRILPVKKRGTLELACGDMEVLYKLEPLYCVRVVTNTGVIIERSREYDRIKVSLPRDTRKKKDKKEGKSSPKKSPKKRLIVSIPKKWSIKNSGHKGVISKST